MMPNSKQSMSRSSQGRGGNTQKEQIHKLQIRARRRKLGNVNATVGGSGRNNVNSIGMLNHIGFTSTIEEVLEEIMCSNGPHLWEKQLLEVIEEYDDKDSRRRVHLYKQTILRIESRLAKKEDPNDVEEFVKTPWYTPTNKTALRGPYILSIY